MSEVRIYTIQQNVRRGEFSIEKVCSVSHPHKQPPSDVCFPGHGYFVILNSNEQVLSLHQVNLDYNTATYLGQTTVNIDSSSKVCGFFSEDHGLQIAYSDNKGGIVILAGE